MRTPRRPPRAADRPGPAVRRRVRAAPRPVAIRCRASGSPTICPTLILGSSEAEGSWKTRWKSLRRGRSRRRRELGDVDPSDADGAAGGVSSRTAHCPTVDLPTPDSPTRPTTSPRSTVSETPSTARTTPPRAGKCRTRSRTSRAGGASCPVPATGASGAGCASGCAPALVTVLPPLRERRAPTARRPDASRRRRVRPRLRSSPPRRASPAGAAGSCTPRRHARSGVRRCSASGWCARPGTSPGISRSRALPPAARAPGRGTASSRPLV